ncbi:hypothetical protein Tco_0964193 [Tanacetum coccineum]
MVNNDKNSLDVGGSCGCPDRVRIVLSKWNMKDVGLWRKLTLVKLVLDPAYIHMSLFNVQQGLLYGLESSKLFTDGRSSGDRRLVSPKSAGQALSMRLMCCLVKQLSSLKGADLENDGRRMLRSVFLLLSVRKIIDE